MIGPLYKTKIFRRQFLSFFILAICFFTAMTFAILFRSRVEIEKHQLEISEAYRVQVSAQLRAWLGERRSDIEMLAGEFALRERDGSLDPYESRDRLAAFVGVKKDFIDAFVVGKDGYIIASKAAVNARRFFVGDRDYVRAAFGGTSYVSSYFRGRLTGSASFAVSVPVGAGDGISYVVVGIISLASVTATVDEIALSNLGAAYLVDGERRLVSRPDFARAFQESEAATEEFVIDTLPAEEIAARRSGTARYRDVAGHTVYGSFQWLDALGLGLVVELGADQALRPITSLLRFSALLAGLMALVLGFLSWWLSSRFLRPIAALIVAAEEVKENRFLVPLTVRTHTELDQLVELFNSMAAEIREREEGLRESAARDGLTGLYNHARIEEFLTLELKRKRRNAEPIAFVMLDIDHFKAVNDNFGHQAGDEVLRRLARILEENVRGGDLLGRYGGEEFAIILNTTKADTVASFCERLRSRVEETVFEAAGYCLNITISLGWTLLASQELSPDGLVRQADRALYEAKARGRNRSVGSSQAGIGGDVSAHS